MRERVLVIYEREENHASRLSGYLSRNPDFPYQVAVFTNSDSLNHYLEQKEADILLLGEECAYEVREVPEGKRILLTEERRDSEEHPWIFKYQSAGNIMREITAYVTGKDENRSGSGPRVYTVYATRGGQERSLYTRRLLDRLKLRGKTLYVNMDLFPAEEGAGKEDWKGMSEVVYYLKQGGEQMRWKIKGLIEEELGVRRIRPVRCSMDLIELTPEDMGMLFRVFHEMQEVDHIVLEVGFYNQTMLEICRLSQEIHLVTPEGCEYETSTEYFMEQLALMRQEGVEGKVQIIRYDGKVFGAGEASESRDEAGVSGQTGFYQRMDR